MELIEKLGVLIPAAQTASAEVDEAAAAWLGLNRTDLRCLGMIIQSGPIAAKDLAEGIKLTRSATTTVLDRLERAGFVVRTADPADRRGIRVEATHSAREAIDKLWQPLGAAGLGVLAKYHDEELEVLIRFFEEYAALQRSHSQTIRALPPRLDA